MAEMPREQGSSVHNRFDSLCVEWTLVTVQDAVCETCRATRAEKAGLGSPPLPREIGT